MTEDHVATMLLDAVRRYGRVKLAPEEPDMGVPFLADFASPTSYPREDMNWAIWRAGNLTSTSG